MMPAAKHFDPVLGVDIHIVQPPGPVPPVPIPHPFVGILIDPFDYLPLIGSTVMINGVHRAIAGTAGKAVPPHIPLGGVFVKPPANECEMFMGSATVSLDGDAASYLALPALSCQCIGMPPPIRVNPKKKSKIASLVLPTSVVLPIPMGLPVLIGGPPTISLMAIGMRVGMAALGKAFKKLRKLQKSSKRIKALSKKLHKMADNIADKLKLGKRAKNRIHRAICTVTGHPVDVATGKVMTDKIDFEIPGPIPIKWERVWYSTSTYRGALGHGWHHSYDMGIYLEDEVVLLRTSDGRLISLPALSEGDEFFDRPERLTLFRNKDGYAIRTVEQLTYHFIDIGRPNREIVLGRITDPFGNQVRLSYNNKGHLAEIIDCAGRSMQFEHDRDGRITAMSAPHPDEEGRQFTVVRYGYDRRGNLTNVLDALDQASSYTYDVHLLVRETDRNGLSFYFAYDGLDEDARCIHTWGDGGIYDHRLHYDDDQSLTTVVDSRGHETVYWHDGTVVTRTKDALGATTRFERNPYNDLVRQTDALGFTKVFEYDARGNKSLITSPDGATVAIDFNERDNPVRAIDPIGGVWEWTYDDLGQLLERTNPLGEKTRFGYRNGLLVSQQDPTGAATNLTYDDSGSLLHLTFPDGGSIAWKYDRLGRPIERADANGNTQRRTFDLLGRVVQLEEPDGNTRRFAHDPEGNAIQVSDMSRTVEYEYTGMGRLAARRIDGNEIQFKYDSEESLIAIVKEDGLAFRFEYGPTGEVTADYGFDGLIRRYERDLLGRLKTVDRADGVVTEYEYDSVGRVTRIRRSDGSTSEFAYRLDGDLVEARSETTVVRLERDALGRITKESQGRHWISSSYDAIGRRTRMESSLGAYQVIERNEMGEVSKVGGGWGASPGHDEGSNGFEVTFGRDLLGYEIERRMPGGVRSRFERDRLGRPVEHEIQSGGVTHRKVRYEWDVSNRLRNAVDSQKGMIKYGYDALGTLVSAEYADNSVEVRVPNAVGNLFRRENRDDRKYGPSGQLLEAIDESGGVTRFKYDLDGNLVERVEADGGIWQYRWNAAGMLSRVVRPDGLLVEFEYDPFARRISKTFRGMTTRWIWDRHSPLHEWVEEARVDSPAVESKEQEGHLPAFLDDLPQHPPTGPPRSDSARADLGRSDQEDPPGRRSRVTPTEAEPVTWLFVPESFAPLARFQGDRQESILTDYLGTPVAMFDSEGRRTWAMSLGIHGDVRSVDAGERGDCPFRFPGQYEDQETGLYYNRFRYFDPVAGQYISQDPLGFLGGKALYQYVTDPNQFADGLGLVPHDTPGYGVYAIVDKDTGDPVYVGITDDFDRRKTEHGKTTGPDGSTPRYDPNKHEFVELVDDVTHGEARGAEQALMEDLGTKTKGKRGTWPSNVVDSVAADRLENPKNVREQAFADGYKKHKGNTVDDALEKIGKACN